MKDDIQNLLLQLNDVFKGDLISTAIPHYVNKIVDHSTIITIYERGRLAAFIAFYNNDYTSRIAFLTMLAVDPLYQNNGLGRLLLKTSIQKLKDEGFKAFNLEVLKINEKAFYLYIRSGFEVSGQTEAHYKMTLKI